MAKKSPPLTNYLPIYEWASREGVSPMTAYRHKYRGLIASVETPDGCYILATEKFVDQRPNSGRRPGQLNHSTYQMREVVRQYQLLREQGLDHPMARDEAMKLRGKNVHD